MPANEVETVVINVHKTFGADSQSPALTEPAADSYCKDKQ